MSKLYRTGAVVVLSLTLTVPAFAGIIHSPGKSDPQPPSNDSTSNDANPINNVAAQTNAFDMYQSADPTTAKTTT